MTGKMCVLEREKPAACGTPGKRSATGSPPPVAAKPDWKVLSIMVDPLSRTDVRPTAVVPTSVYTYFDDQDMLLYVGITSRGVQRNREHNTSKAWWPFVVRQEVEHFDTRGTAMIHEARTIHRFRPPFNTQHNPGYLAVRSAYLQYREMRSVTPAGLDEYKALGRRLDVLPMEQDSDGLSTVLRSTSFVATTAVGVKPGAIASSPTRKYGPITRVWKSGPLVLMEIGGKVPPVVNGTAVLKWDTKERAIYVTSLLINVEYDLLTKNGRNRRNREQMDVAARAALGIWQAGDPIVQASPARNPA